MEQFFEFNKVGWEQRVQVAAFHLEGIALQWHRWLTKLCGPLTWDELTKAALLHFGPTKFDDPSEALTRLRQTTTVASYQESFERLSNCVDDLPEKFLIGCFVAGLRDEIRIDVKIKHPSTLAEAIGVARLIEERNQVQRKTTPFSRAFNVTVQARTVVIPTTGLLGPSPSARNSSNSITPSTPLRRITNQEAKERRERGLVTIVTKKIYLAIGVRDCSCS